MYITNIVFLLPRSYDLKDANA